MGARGRLEVARSGTSSLLPSCHWTEGSSRGRLPQFWRWQRVTLQLQVAISELPPPERGCQSPTLGGGNKVVGGNNVGGGNIKGNKWKRLPSPTFEFGNQEATVVACQTIGDTTITTTAAVKTTTATTITTRM